MAARGELPEAEEASEPEATTAERRGGFLRTLFPAAPPLAGRPDPLAGFDASGPMRPIQERAFLLRRNLLAWVVPGVVAFIGFFASLFYAQGVLGLIGTFILFGALIGAGWFGWQRPTLYGTAAGVLCFILSTATIFYTFAAQGAPPDTFGAPGAIILDLAVQGAYQAGLGFLGGWYGGYLRRRQAQLSTETRRRR